nr:radical SAM family heme chaperone HemW [Alkalilacustris brevis]
MADIYAIGEDWREGGFGLYFHWPFCEAKCPYCDFNSHVAGAIDQGRWRAAFRSEIARVAALTPGRVVNSVFFGGGTPSLMEAETVAAVLQAVQAAWPLANDLEVTLEANPRSVEAARFKAYRDAGVNRVSMGMQALNDADLRRLGRLHSVQEGIAAFETAQAVFDRVSFDLIYARQDQSLKAWESELSQALGMAADHLSLYQLTIEAGTAFGARAAGGRLHGLPDDDVSADMYMITQDICEGFGFSGYETSNHAAPGAESRHNLIYWRSGDYAGIGPGAHGRLTLPGRGRIATETPLSPDAWLARVEKTGDGTSRESPLPPEDQAMEYLMMALRLTEGCDLERYARLNGAALSPEKLASLEEMALVQRDGQRLRTTVQGRIVLNAILRELLA